MDKARFAGITLFAIALGAVGYDLYPAVRALQTLERESAVILERGQKVVADLDGMAACSRLEAKTSDRRICLSSAAHRMQTTTGVALIGMDIRNEFMETRDLSLRDAFDALMQRRNTWADPDRLVAEKFAKAHDSVMQSALASAMSLGSGGHHMRAHMVKYEMAHQMQLTMHAPDIYLKQIQ